MAVKTETVREVAVALDDYASHAPDVVEPIGTVQVPISLLVRLRRALRAEGARP